MSTGVFEIPLKSGGSQRRSISLNGIVYQLTVRWNWIAELWFIDIADNSGNAMVSGIPMVAGTDLLEQYAYLGMGIKLFAQTDHAPSIAPTFDNLGDTGHLYFTIT